MIPVSLTLKNFMCYRDNVPSLSFEGIHTACLYGDNGNGKSAIFDALTWVLWGKSRAESDDSLIHYGQTEMLVELEFMLAQQKYRVIRTRYKKNTVSSYGHSTLELHIYSELEGYKTISGNTIAETQMKIIRLLHIDYETFVNSAFLRQGHANDFSIKRPSERKEILVNILGLDIYDLLVDKARDEAAINRNTADNIRKQIDNVEDKLKFKDSYKQDLFMLTEQRKELETTRANLEAQISILMEQKSLLQVKKEKYSHFNLRNIEIEGDLDKWKAKIEDCTTKLESYRKILNISSLIENKYSELIVLKQRLDNCNAKLSQVVNVQVKIRQIEEYLRKKEQGILLDLAKQKELLKTNEENASKIGIIRKEQIRINGELNILSVQEGDLLSKRQSHEKLVTNIANIKANMNIHKTVFNENIEKARLLETDDSRCPVCGQTITQQEREEIRKAFLKTAEESRQAADHSLVELEDNNKESEILLNTISIIENNIKVKRNDLLSQNAILLNRINEAQKAAEYLPEINSRISELQEQLSSRSYAAEDHQELKKLMKTLDDIQYDKQEHEKIKTEFEQIREYEILKQKLNEAITMSANEQKNLDEARTIIADLDSILKSNNEQLNLLSAEIKNLEGSVQMLKQQEDDLKAILNDERNMLSQIAIYQERMRELESMEADKKRKELLLSTVQMEEDVYTELAEAFGKKGVQALLISQAFPEIEIEANRLLSKMSDNKLSLKLESRKEARSKKGESIETLDIKISDELGTRNYEMFSGGESFRIDLSLRIALSKLLVRRAGASLPLLIIDEGFGTQDSAGKERLIEAIKSIEDDFEKIFIITHLEDLKESFPVIINVSKSAEGSAITIS